MKAWLMHRDRDLDLPGDPPPDAAALTQDLGLNVLFRSMAQGDEFLLEVVRRVVPSSLNDPDAIVYRQRILQDCLEQADVVRELYAIAVDAVRAERAEYLGMLFGRSPDTTLYRSVRLLEAFVGLLKRLRRVAGEQAGRFGSEGFARFFEMVRQELDDEYFGVVQAHLRELQFRDGCLISAGLGTGNRGSGYVLRRPLTAKRSWMRRIFDRGEPAYAFEIADRDDAGMRALAELRGRGLNPVADALAQSVDHILAFFGMLRTELGFYIACLNLREHLARLGQPTCWPVPRPAGAPALTADGLYDVCLALVADARVVGNELAADGRRLVIITGANQGGKSTFLRSVGLAQLLMQCGMFVPAERFRAGVCSGVFTHFKREEDAAMKHGKLDEELVRMSRIVDGIRPNGLLLCNESFASTNEREGSEIARQIVRALLETGVKVFYVTHLFDLAKGFHENATDAVLFLRAERQAGGRRTFKLLEGEPLPTSYGEDLYREIFGDGADDGADP